MQTPGKSSGPKHESVFSLPLSSSGKVNPLEFGPLVVAGRIVGGATVEGANVGSATVGGANVGGATVGGANVGGATVGGATVGGAGCLPRSVQHSIGSPYLFKLPQLRCD